MGDGVEEEGRSNTNHKRVEEDVVPDEQQERRSPERNQQQDPQVSKKSPNFSLHLSHEQIMEEFPSSTKRR
ncbi:hypothetical protein TRIUR3_32700 [Triticum urartu]|uniref:Uncharacterized protein n=1 Tax=Triticum urartu TaxID=4572 RepID=M8A6V7_TRIUA|nr:hypothetical protein TRIUR3_32700 [Triticum urartu]